MVNVKENGTRVLNSNSGYNSLHSIYTDDLGKAMNPFLSSGVNLRDQLVTFNSSRASG